MDIDFVLHGDGPAVDRALAARPAVERSAARVIKAVPPLLAGAADVVLGMGRECLGRVVPLGGRLALVALRDLPSILPPLSQAISSR